jgi:Family of unknown function (DUF6220)
MVRRLVSRLHRGGALVLLLGFVLQFYLVGAALFGFATFEMHRGLGYLLAILVLVVLLLAVVGGLGRRLIGLSALLLALTLVQTMLPSLRGGAPWLAALHPVNALALMGITATLVRYRPVSASPQR